MYRHLPKGKKRRVLPKKDKSLSPYIMAGRVMRQIPDMSYAKFCVQLRLHMGELPDYMMRWHMYTEYTRHHDVKIQYKYDVKE